MRKLSIREMKKISGGVSANSACFTVCRDEFGVEYVHGFDCPNGVGNWQACETLYGPGTCARCSSTCGSTMWVCA